MGFFEKFTKPSPEAQQLIDLQKRQLAGQAEEIRGQIANSKDARIAALNAAHASRIAPIEAQIAARQSERLDLRKQVMLGSNCSMLTVGLLSPLGRIRGTGTLK